MPENSFPVSSTVPVYPMREQVIFPHMIFPLFVDADEMSLFEEALRLEHMVGISSCFSNDQPLLCRSLSQIGTLCRISKIIRFPEGGCKVVLEGLKRIRLLEITKYTPYIVARIEPIRESEEKGLVAEALVQSVNALLKIALAYGRPLPGDVVKMVDQIDDPSRLADLVSVYLNLELRDQQHLLEMLDPMERLKEVYLHLASEVQKLQVRGEIQSEVARRIGKNQKEFLLKEQMKQIQQELGNEDPRQAEIEEFRRRINDENMPENVQTVAQKELARLEKINPASPEYTVSRTYLEYLCNVPWNKGTEDELDVNLAQQVLDEDHYNLKEVKERILEYLAVRSLRATTKGPILCFVGPPGVGKTSLGRSIARAMGRKFIRMSLGGMKDEAEIRGHRRTYIGALPGRIVQEICRAEANNPVFMLDEVDKIGQDFRGDPASALLEVLDPEQNSTFSDHYLDVPLDLSKVMFITTANVMDPVPHALKDRMEVIRLSGYSDEEKKQIAFKYLVPKEQFENGLERFPLEFEEGAVEKIIQNFTREPGVRNLERKIASIMRKVAREITQKQEYHRVITSQSVDELLGPRLYYNDVAGEVGRVGVVTGLAWTESGGDIIFVEASSMVGNRNLTLTGSLGDVMQESARTALSYVRAHALEFGIEPDFFDHTDLHIHVPSGAIPKDGPSAGITMAAALVSLLTRRPARPDVAMTGELTLSGRILPIGGLKEKVLAAKRAGVTTVLLPKRNKENLIEIDEKITSQIKLVLVDNLRDVIANVLSPDPGDDLRCLGLLEDSDTQSPGHQPLYPA